MLRGMLSMRDVSLMQQVTGDDVSNVHVIESNTREVLKPRFIGTGTDTREAYENSRMILLLYEQIK
jgi:hypothetical protein